MSKGEYQQVGRKEFAHRSKCRFFELVGAAPQPKMTNADQLTNFMQQLVIQSGLPLKKDILRTLGNGPLTATQIAERLGNERNGHLTRQLKELETAGFVAREGGLNPQTDAPLKIERLSEAGDSLHFVIPSDRH